MYLFEYKHEKVHASDDKSLKMNQLGNKMQPLDGTEKKRISEYPM